MMFYMDSIALLLYIFEHMSWKLSVFGLVLYYMFVAMLVLSVKLCLLKRQVAAARAAAASSQAREMPAAAEAQAGELQRVIPVAQHVLLDGEQGNNELPQGQNNVLLRGQIIRQQHNNELPQGQNNVLRLQNGALAEQAVGVAVVANPRPPQIKRNYLKRALEHVTNMDKKLKEDVRLLDSMQERHKRQRTNLRTQHASSRQTMTDGHSSRQLALGTESTRSMHALDAAHAQAHPVASADELEVHNTAQMELHFANHRAENSSQIKFDSDLMAMHVEQEERASAMQRGHKVEERNFELRSLNAHNELYSARY